MRKDEPIMVYLVRASSEELAARGQRVGSNGWRFSTEQSGELADVVVHDIGTKRYAFYVVFPPEASQQMGDRFLNSITLRQ